MLNKYTFLLPLDKNSTSFNINTVAMS